MALALAAFGGDTSLPAQNAIPGAASPFPAGSARHKTRTESELPPPSPNISEIPAPAAIEVPSPTRTSFMANWPSKSGATGYLLDVSTSNSFGSYVNGYHDLDVANVTGRVVTGLKPGTTYYYRVRAYDASGAGDYSAVTTATTVATTGLIIEATFDSSITNSPNAAAIEAMINRAISFHESLFSDPVTIHIRFRYATTSPDGTPLSPGTISESDFVVYQIPWSQFINALTADAKTSNDNLANASLPGAPLSASIKPSSANGRAVSLNTPPAMLANGTIGNGPYDGIVTLNSTAPYQFTRPVNASSFDAQRATEHEVDEVIGLGSNANVSDLRPQDLFSWSSAGQRNVTSNGLRYFSINGGSTNIVSFNQLQNGDLGDWVSEPCPQDQPYVQNAFGCTGQFSDISSTSPEGINLDVIGYDLSRVTLGNISTRSLVQTGADVMIGGFIIEGSGPKTVIIRAIGPELTPFGVPNALADPTLELHNGAGTLIASNNDWQTTVIGGIITSNQVGAIQ
ncbi:MAG: fibronectin type III domain-containing protein, partial [Verrucomicrobia bacterium]|nr:fibronectin type III domain-containing protein [Verrucomicrobiota bacterium]